MIYVPDNVADGSYLLNQMLLLKMMQVRVNPFCTPYLTSDLEEMNLETYYDYCLKRR
jgi:hypothetical protein